MPDTLSQAKAAADRLIRFRPRSEQELRQRLHQKGYEVAAIDAVVQDFARRDLINDRKFAQYYATNRLSSRPMGLRALRQELRRKGIDGAVVEQTVVNTRGDYDELAAARELAQRRCAQLKGLPAATVQRRLAGLLQRRGFSGDVVYRAIREATTTQERPETT